MMICRTNSFIAKDTSMTILPVAYNKKSATLASSGLLLATLTATGCQSTVEPVETTNSQTMSSPSKIVSTDISQQTLRQQALRIQLALANKDFSRITNDIHPIRGVRFSMYAYVRPESDKVFSRTQYEQYLNQSNIRFTWGKKDGTGDLLITTLPTYLDTWVNGKTFDNAAIRINESTNNGNSINNLKEIYPQSEVVEFYNNGTEAYAGMDWRILRLVFDEYQGKRYLIAVINDQWTV